MSLPTTGPIMPELALELYYQGERNEAIATVKRQYATASSAEIFIGALLELGVALWQVQANIAHLQKTIADIGRAPAGTYSPRACYFCGTDPNCRHR